jgi:transcriptional regulator with XRE-family HTH domain
MAKTTQKQIAKQAGISGQWLSDIIGDRGRPAWETAKKLAEITNTSPALWMDGDTAAKAQAMETCLDRLNSSTWDEDKEL